MLLRRYGSCSQDAGFAAQLPKNNLHVFGGVTEGLTFHDLGHLVPQPLPRS